MTKIKTVFVVDDDPITVFGLKKMLTEIGSAQEIQTFGQPQATGIEADRVFGQDIEALLGGPVFLSLFVRVEPKWSRQAKGLRKMGY